MQRPGVTELAQAPDRGQVQLQARVQADLERARGGTSIDLLRNACPVVADSLRRQANTVVRLTVVTILGLIGTITTGFLGMNLLAEAFVGSTFRTVRRASCPVIAVP